MKIKAILLALIFSATLCSALALHAEETIKIHATVLTASNNGSDYDLVNDEYRDQLIKLFSYSSYHQLADYNHGLSQSAQDKIDLPEGYELLLTLQGIQQGRVEVRAVIQRDGMQYVDTVLSILRPGVVFLGGPPTAGGGALIIILETGF